MLKGLRENTVSEPREVWYQREHGREDQHTVHASSQKPQGKEGHSVRGCPKVRIANLGGHLAPWTQKGKVTRVCRRLEQPTSHMTTHLIDRAGGRSVLSWLRTRGCRRCLLLGSGLLLRQKNSKCMVTGSA